MNVFHFWAKHGGSTPTSRGMRVAGPALQRGARDGFGFGVVGGGRCGPAVWAATIRAQGLLGELLSGGGLHFDLLTLFLCRNTVLPDPLSTGWVARKNSGTSQRGGRALFYVFSLLNHWNRNPVMPRSLFTLFAPRFSHGPLPWLALLLGGVLLTSVAQAATCRSMKRRGWRHRVSKGRLQLDESPGCSLRTAPHKNHRLPRVTRRFTTKLPDSISNPPHPKGGPLSDPGLSEIHQMAQPTLQVGD